MTFYHKDSLIYLSLGFFFVSVSLLFFRVALLISLYVSLPFSSPCLRVRGGWEAAEEEQDGEAAAFPWSALQCRCAEGSKGLSRDRFSSPGQNSGCLSQRGRGYCPTGASGWAESSCRCGCETGSKISFQSLFVGTGDHTG